MKRVMVTLMVLLVAGLTISASGAFSIPSSLSQLSLPAQGASSLGQSVPDSGLSSFGFPASGFGQSVPMSGFGQSMPLSGFGQSVPSGNLQVSTPSQSAFGSGWGLNDMQFFSPSNSASAKPANSIPGSDIVPILEMLGKLPVPNQSQQNSSQSSTSPSPTPTPEQTFQNVSTTIPADQVIFIEVSRNTMLTDPTSQGIIIPNVTMNYKFSDKDKKLSLKKKPGVNYNASQVYFGFSDSDDVNNHYVFDYGIGSCPVMSVPVVFSGADGRVSVMVNGQRKDLMPGQKAEIITNQGNTRTTLDVTNWGLIPRANVNIADTI